MTHFKSTKVVVAQTRRKLDNRIRDEIRPHPSIVSKVLLCVCHWPIARARLEGKSRVSCHPSKFSYLFKRTENSYKELMVWFWVANTGGTLRSKILTQASLAYILWHLFFPRIKVILTNQNTTHQVRATRKTHQNLSFLEIDRIGSFLRKMGLKPIFSDFKLRIF